MKLRTRSFTIDHWLLERFSAKEVKLVHTYLTDTPRMTSIGRVLEFNDVARILGVTMRDSVSPWKAMQFDAIDGIGNGGMNAALKRCGLPELPRDNSDMDPEQTIRITAALHAEEFIYTHINYRKDKSGETFAAFMDLIQRRPADTERILGYARKRQSIDVELMEEMLGNAAGALEVGIL